MHPVFRGSLIERFLPFDGLDGDFGLFFCTVSFSVNRHLFPPLDVPRHRFILSYLPVQFLGDIIQYLPANLYLGIIFFNLPTKEQKKLELLNKLMPTTFLRGFRGGIVISADGLDQRKTALFTYLPIGENPLFLARVKGRTLLFEDGDIWSDNVDMSPGEHIVCMFGWAESNFSR